MLKAEKLKKNYGNKKILDIDSIEFHKGKIYSIVGSNGIGKSTFLKILFGLIDSDSGTIIRDTDNISYNPQEEIFLKGSVLYNIVEPFNLIGKKISLENMDDYLKKFEIENLKNEDVSFLSGGEKAKVQFIRTILYDDDYLLLDEPTASMDKNATKILESILIEERNKNKGIIIVTHDYIQAKKISDFILEIDEGKIKELVF